MRLTRRRFGILLGGTGLGLAGPLLHSAVAQDQAPNRRLFEITVRNYAFDPDRIEVAQEDIVRLTVTSADQAHSFTIDEYRIAKRVPAGGTTTFEFRADRTGTFSYYCSLTIDPGCRATRGTLVVHPRQS